MPKYNIGVFLDNGSEIKISSEYDKIYELQLVVSNYGRNGIWDTKNDKQIYFPPNRISRIEIEQQN